MIIVVYELWNLKLSKLNEHVNVIRRVAVPLTNSDREEKYPSQVLGRV